MGYVGGGGCVTLLYVNISLKFMSFMAFKKYTIEIKVLTLAETFCIQELE